MLPSSVHPSDVLREHTRRAGSYKTYQCRVSLVRYKIVAVSIAESGRVCYSRPATAMPCKFIGRNDHRPVIIICIGISTIKS